MKLHEIAPELDRVWEALTLDALENDGVVNDDLSDQLQALEIAYDQKVEGIALCIKNLSVMIDAFDAEEKRIYARRKSMQDRMESIKQYLNGFVVDKFETPRVKISFRNSSSVEVLDIDKLPDICVNVKQVKSADKAYIKEKLMLGQEVEGCRIVDKRNIIIK